MTVTLRNVGGDPVDLWAPGGAPGAFGVDSDGSVEVSGVVLAEADDHYLIGPEDTEWAEGTDVPGEVRAWPKATWQVESGGTPRKQNKKGDADA